MVETNSRKSLLEDPMMETGKLPTPHQRPISSEYSSTPSYSDTWSPGHWAAEEVSSFTCTGEVGNITQCPQLRYFSNVTT